MNQACDIRSVVRISESDVLVWTNVGEAHLGFFASVGAIADAKAEIFEGARATDVLVANADDPLIAARLDRFGGRVVTFGIDRAADVCATAIVDRGIDGTSARVTTPRGQVNLATPLVGRVNLANVLAATAVAIEFDVPLADIAARAAALQPAAHRGEVVRLAGGVTVIDDSYNANPTATKRALDVLAGSPAARRIAVLGEMLELGDRAEALHADVGPAVAHARIHALCAAGGDAARAMADAAAAAGMPGANAPHFAPRAEPAGAAAALAPPG